MCLIAWNYQPGTALPLLVVANRDEFYARPALPLHHWPCGQVLAGQDAQAGGTWLGLGDAQGQSRFAAITNYRDAALGRSDAPTRGALVPDFLRSNGSAADFLADLQARAVAYNPFNLLLFDGTALLGFESQSRRIVTLAPGIGAVSNARFNTPWPKLLQLKQALESHVDKYNQGYQGFQGLPPPEPLLALLEHRTPAPDHALPRTGIALERERALSSIFIQTPDYGTRASSVVWLSGQGGQGASMVEKTFDAQGSTGQRRLSLLAQ